MVESLRPECIDVHLLRDSSCVLKFDFVSNSSIDECEAIVDTNAVIANAMYRWYICVEGICVLDFILDVLTADPKRLVVSAFYNYP